MNIICIDDSCPFRVPLEDYTRYYFKDNPKAVVKSVRFLGHAKRLMPKADVVLCDWNLQKCKADKVYDYYKAKKFVILFTEYDEKEVNSFVVKHPEIKLVSKPFNDETLFEVLDTLGVK